MPGRGSDKGLGSSEPHGFSPGSLFLGFNQPLGFEDLGFCRLMVYCGNNSHFGLLGFTALVGSLLLGFDFERVCFRGKGAHTGNDVLHRWACKASNKGLGLSQPLGGQHGLSLLVFK
jgi:hypothetical protein